MAMLYCNALRFALKDPQPYFDTVPDELDDYDFGYGMDVSAAPYPRPSLAQYSPYQMFAVKSLLNVTTPRIVMSQSNYRRGNPHAGPTILNPEILSSLVFRTDPQSGKQIWSYGRDVFFVYAFQDPDKERAHLQDNSLIDSEFLTVLQKFAKETFCYSQQLSFYRMTPYLNDGERKRIDRVIMKSIVSNTEFHNLIHLDFKDLTNLDEDMIFDALSAPGCRWKRPQLLQSLDLRNTGIPSMPSETSKASNKEPVFLSSILNKFFPFLKKLRVNKTNSGSAKYDLIRDLENVPTFSQTLEEITFESMLDTDCTSFVETVSGFKKLRKLLFSGNFDDKDEENTPGLLTEHEKLQYPGGETVFSKLRDCSPSLECIDFEGVSAHYSVASSIFIKGLLDILRFCGSSLRVLNLSRAILTFSDDASDEKQLATGSLFCDTLFEFCPDLEILGIGSGLSTRMPVMVTDKFLQEIPSNLTKLKLINLFAQTKISDSAISTLRKAMPELIVLSHDAIDDTSSDDLFDF